MVELLFFNQNKRKKTNNTRNFVKKKIRQDMAWSLATRISNGLEGFFLTSQYPN